ncbi:hypothetical protein [Sphingomonas sp. KR3-1]|uniref:hypothetical protein n=1 Tax=Sphingomonas sp. KR3-1 TaxID=3156611 RepID=UPI0032B492E0
MLALALAGCHGPERVGVDVAFDVEADGSATSAKCIASTGGACQIDFRGALPQRVVLQPGEMRRFPEIGPGVPVCIAAEAAELSHCQPTTLATGYARIRKGRYNRLA